MAFDMGWNFRGTSTFVTDDAHYGVPVLAETYPHTYTNGDGQSINAGWVGGINGGASDRINTNDPRIAGINYGNASQTNTFKADLSSGSAPGAGSYSIDVAFGDQGGSRTYTVAKIQDNTTDLISASGTVVSDHYFDATTADVNATTTWTGTPVVKSFATTTANLVMSDPASFTTVAHFRLTLQTGGTASTLHSLMLLGVGA